MALAISVIAGALAWGAIVAPREPNDLTPAELQTGPMMDPVAGRSTRAGGADRRPVARRRTRADCAVTPSVGASAVVISSLRGNRIALELGDDLDHEVAGLGRVVADLDARVAQRLHLGVRPCPCRPTRWRRRGPSSCREAR